MRWYRADRSLVLLLLAVIACDAGQAVAPSPSFMVITPPAAVSATAVSYRQINLTWQDNSRNESGFEVHRSNTGPGGTFTLLASTSGSATGYADYGVSALTQFCYKVRAFRTTGRKNAYSDFSSVACATTPVSPVPAAASNVNAVPAFGYAVSLTWTDNASDEQGYRVERASSAGGPWTAVNTTGAGATALYDYQYVSEQTLCYRVIGFNSYGDSDPSNVDCTAIPATPTDLAASVNGAAVNLTWTDRSNVEDGFDVLRAAPGADWVLIMHLAANTNSYPDASLSPDIMYTYSVRATRDGGTSGGSNYVQAMIVTAPPSAPVSVDAVPYGSTSVIVYWGTGSSNQAGYRIEHSTDGGATWSAVGTAARDESYITDWPVVAEQPVCYRVTAFNQFGDSPASSVDCAMPPAGPTNLTATLQPDGTAELAWTDNSNVEDGYQVWVDEGWGGGSYIIAVLDSNTTSFIDSYCPGCYYYSVVATNDGGYSDFSDWIWATYPAGISGMRARPAAPTSHPKPMLQRQGVPR